MTSDGSPYQRFRRAIATGNLNIIRACAAELPRIGVAEAASILLVIAEREPDRYQRAAVRWLGKLCLERSDARLADLGALAAALAALPADPAAARAALVTACEDAGLREAAVAFGR